MRAYIDGHQQPIMEAVAEWPDEWYAITASSLPVGAAVRAEQSLNGSTSALSTEAVTILDASTTRPLFEAPLQGCANVAVLSGIAPGARVKVRAANGTVLADAESPGSRLEVQLARFTDIGEVLYATTTACGAASGGEVSSLPAEPMTGGQNFKLQPPILDGALQCQRILHFHGLQIGSILSLRRDSGTVTWTCSSRDLYGRIDPPLRAGEQARFWQSPPSSACKVIESDATMVTVSSDPPAPPRIVTRPCPGTQWLQLEGLIPSATVTILVDGLIEVCRFEAAETSQGVDLGSLVLMPGQRLRAAQGLCGQFGLPSVSSWVTRPAAGRTPSMPERLVECATVVRVAGLAAASRVSVFSDKLQGRIGFGFTDTEGSLDVAVSPPLVATDRIYATVSGCSPGTAAREVEGTQDIPPALIAAPHDDDASVLVSNLVPGCRVDVFVDERWAGGASSGGTTARISLLYPLVDEQSVSATVRLCSQSRNIPAVFVAPPRALHWLRPTPRGLQMDTGHFMSGRVTAALPLTQRLLLGTEEAGLWLMTPDGGSAPLSLDWPTPKVICLGHRDRGPVEEAAGTVQVWCGTTDGLYATDHRAAAPLVSWHRANDLPGPGGPGGVVNDILIISAKARMFVATDRGIWWSPISSTPGAGYRWSSDPLVSGMNILSLCEGPGWSVIGYGPRVGATGGFVRGTWFADSQLQWTNTTPGGAAIVADPRLNSVVAYMANGRLAVAASDRTRVFAALADSRDNAWLGVLRSDDGGASWSIPYADSDLKFFKPTGSVDMGFQADRNLDVLVHPHERDRVLLAARRGGLLGSANGGQTWDIPAWPPVVDGSFHADCLCIEYDHTDASGNTVVVGSDGGVFISTDFGHTWDTSYNERLPTLMFEQQWDSAFPALSASEMFPGLLVGALQDNGKAYLSADGEPWRELGHVGDGERALFVTGDIVLNGGNDDVEIRWARWNGTSFVDQTTIAVAHPPNTEWMPNISRVVTPSYSDPTTGAPMIAVAADNLNTGNVFGLFDRGAAYVPVAKRMYWSQLGTVPFQTTAIASLTGHLVLVGAGEDHVFLLDPTTGVVTLTNMPDGLERAGVRMLSVGYGSLAFALVGDTLIRTTDMNSWTPVATPPGARSPVIALERALDPPRLVLAGSDGAWISRDLGATWKSASAGLPNHPQANNLEVVEYPSGERFINLGTWNWSAWRSRLD